jgi:hypothetical protein
MGSLFFMGSGCCSGPKAPFLIGIYAVRTNQLPDVAAEGFDLVVGPGSQNYLRQASMYGLKVLGTGGDFTTSNSLSLAHVLLADKEPSLWAWHIVDEPDLHNISPWAVKVASQRLKQIAKKPTLVVLSSGSAVEKYSKSADFIGVDYYPVPWAPISTFAREMRLARVGAGGKPFYAIIQAFSWEAFPELIDTDKKLREPTYDELRCMSYLAMSHGARGVLFYKYSESGWQLKEHPQLWTSVERIVADLRQDSHLFQHRIAWWPIETRHKGQGLFNEILEPRMPVFMFEVARKKDDIERGFYFIAINTTGDEIEFSFQLPFRTAKAVNSYHSEGGIQVQGRWITKNFHPFEVSIVGPIVPAEMPEWLKAQLKD